MGAGRSWEHGLIDGAVVVTDPYGYLTHLQLSYTPLGYSPDLPAEQDGAALERWVIAHVDW
ncbi:hypothetical protein [Streptomyces sp. NPDC058486]|uniref:hypothetical protein n=1 Tax=unclassified Streptomyces TaxID=2593676 RepID=UPI0036499D61